MSEIDRLADILKDEIGYLAATGNADPNDWREAVRAILTAMREPSGEAQSAGRATDCIEYDSEDGNHLDYLGPKVIWQAMIDHILSEP